jgi:3-hydroxybutyryl-CoA dehydrogenase
MTLIRHIGVIGAGQMGTGIAQVSASVIGVNKVLLYDQSLNAVNKSMGFISKMLQKDVGKGRIQESDRERIMQSIKPIERIEDLEGMDIVIEAIKEDLDVKCKLFNQLSGLTRKETILASNTSSISITKLASVTTRPDKVIGMHFMNPVPIMQLVEVIRGLGTSDSTLQSTLDLVKSMGKVATQSRDIPGFIANRCLMPYINEAIFTLYEGIGTANDIDTTMKLGCNMPMGPLQLADFIGLDTCLAILQVLHTQLGDPKYRPCPLLAQYVQAGWLGKKTGRGFQSYQ